MKETTNLKLLYAFNFLKSLHFFGALSVPFYTIRLGFTYTHMFSLEAIFSVLLFFFEIPTGVVADKFGRRISLFLGSVLFGASFVLYGFARTYPVLVIIQATCALGLSLMSGADRALVYEVSRAIDDDAANIAARNGRYDSFGTAGMLAAFPIGSVFATSGILSYTQALGAVFVATGASMLISVLLLIRVRENPRPVLTEHPLALGIRGFLTLFRSRDLALLSINTAVISSFTFLMFWLYQSLLMEMNFPVAGFGFVAAAFNALGMVLLFNVGTIRKKLSDRTFLLATSVLPGILYLVAGLFPVIPVALIAIMGVTAMRFIRAPVTATLINDGIGDELRATVLSGLSMLERIVTTGFYFVVGFLSDRSVPLALLVIGVLTLLVSFLVRPGRGRRTHQARTSHPGAPGSEIVTSGDI
ncbi:MAG: MFS transporter [Treponema sp.]|nr:MAG: MFS transporter [Treponema sp.]